MHLVNDLKQQVVDVRRYLLVISLTTCRLNDICKEVCLFLCKPPHQQPPEAIENAYEWCAIIV